MYWFIGIKSKKKAAIMRRQPLTEIYLVMLALRIEC
jgi:hypothetical protein